MQLRVAAVLLALAWGVSGCFHVCYLAQAARGQDELAYLAQPIDEVLSDPAVPSRTRAMIATIPSVKRFGEAHGMRPTDNYQHFVQLDRDSVVWVVTASPALSLEPVTWYFPIVGSVPYLGWFNHNDAVRFADELREQGYDVLLRGAGAYSTLGWFDDPVLSTMIVDEPGGAADLINTVLHESVHATTYVESQSAFNESLADFIADELTVRYLSTEQGYNRLELDAFVQQQKFRAHRILRLHQTSLALTELYASNRSDREKLAIKERVLTALGHELGARRPLNNANLTQARTYHSGEPHFAALFEACGKDWHRFWEVIKTIDADDFAHPQQEQIGPVVRAQVDRCAATAPSPAGAQERPRPQVVASAVSNQEAPLLCSRHK